MGKIEKTGVCRVCHKTMSMHLRKVLVYHEKGKDKGWIWVWQVFYDPSGYAWGFWADAFGDPYEEYIIKPNQCSACIVQDYRHGMDEFIKLQSGVLTCPKCSRVLVSYKYGSIEIAPLWTKEAGLCLNCADPF